MTDDQRRALPSVDTLLRDPRVVALMTTVPRNAVVAAVREAIERSRKRRAGPPDDWAGEITELVAARMAPSLARVINATGIVLHTNLGRAPLPTAAVHCRPVHCLRLQLARVRPARGYPREPGPTMAACSSRGSRVPPMPWS
jgi:hypothetical protein